MSILKANRFLSLLNIASIGRMGTLITDSFLLENNKGTSHQRLMAKGINPHTPEKLSCFRKSARWKFFHHLPAHIVECVSEYILFVSNKKKHRIKKQKKLKKIEKQKEANEEKEKENIVVANNICGKSNRIRWYRLTICFVCF